VTSLSKTAVAALLGSAVYGMTAESSRAFAPSPAAVSTTPVVPSVPVKADPQTDPEMKKTLEETNKKLGTIQEQLQKLTELLNGKKDDKGFPLPSDPGLVAEVRALKDRLEKLERDLSGLKTQTTLRPPSGPSGGTGSGSIPTPMPGPGTDPQARKAIVRVVNEYPAQVSIVVNGTSYRVAPSKTVDVEVPAGEFTYQLLESGGAITRSTIKEKETVTLRIK
jgi:hypothetical protein